VADVVLAEVGAGGVQSDPDVEMRIKITDSDDPAITATTDAFVVKYHTITWRVIDANGNPITGLNTNEPSTTTPSKAAWSVVDNSFSGNSTIRYYPDNEYASDDTYSTLFEREESGTVYSVSSGAWRADSDKTITLLMDTAATASVTYTVEIDAVYDATEDAINVICWLTKKGLLVEDIYSDPNAAVSVNVYDVTGVQLNSSDLGTGISPNINGIFKGINYNPSAGLDPAATYTIKAVITYNFNTYTGITAFVAPSVFTYAVNIGTVYNSTNDSMVANVWLERSGTIITDPGDVTLTVYDSSGTSVFTQSYDGYDSTSDTTYASILNNGVYSGIEWDPEAGITSNVVYAVKAQIAYRSKAYSVIKAFSKGETGEIMSKLGVSGSETLVSKIVSEAAATRTQVANDVASQAATTRLQIISEAGTTRTAVTTAQSDIKAEITSKATATQTAVASQAASTVSTISSKITATQSTLRSTIALESASRILTQQSYLKEGDTLVVRYKTATGLEPTISVYDANNTLQLSEKKMTEPVSGSGIYEYSVTFNWGRGEHTIICKEDTQGTLDGINIEVISTDLEDISTTATTTMAQLSSIDTETINTLGTSIEEVNSVVGKIVGNIDELASLSTKVKELADKTTATIYEELELAAEKLEEINEGQGLKIERMYELSEDQSTDVDYIKNKTLEIKALVELSQEILSRESDEPIVKTWMESGFTEIGETEILEETMSIPTPGENVLEELEGIERILEETEGVPAEGE
jgi:hypothetical protein